MFQGVTLALKLVEQPVSSAVITSTIDSTKIPKLQSETGSEIVQVMLNW